VLACQHFVVHVLAADQVDLSQRMARPAEDKFIGLPLEDGLGGTPRLRGSLATFECALWKTVEAGDHVIFLGRVERYHHVEGEPLVFVNGRYAHPPAPRAVHCP
jgi:flavin reductase (DIM6/NTAB) family NADH-FMN oxidoreductase RutF